MHPVNNFADAKRVLHYLIASLTGWERTKVYKNQICWRIHKDGMVGPRQIEITEYAKGVYRLKGGL